MSDAFRPPFMLHPQTRNGGPRDACPSDSSPAAARSGQYEIGAKKWRLAWCGGAPPGLLQSGAVGRVSDASRAGPGRAPYPTVYKVVEPFTTTLPFRTRKTLHFDPAGTDWR